MTRWVAVLVLVFAARAWASDAPHSGGGGVAPPPAPASTAHPADSPSAPEHPAPGDGGGAHHADIPHPEIARNENGWAGAVTIVILALFVAAAVIGPIVRSEMPPPEVPDRHHSHDEPPGASGHHGPGGTFNPDEPRNVHEREHGHGGHH